MAEPASSPTPVPLPIPTPTTPSSTPTPILATASSPLQQPPLPPTPKEPNLFQNIIAGAIAGVIGQSIIFPFYTAKTRLQSNPSIYRTIPSTFRRIVSQEGFRGLYKGLPAALVGVAPEKAIKLSANDSFRRFFSENGDGKRLPLSRSVASGGLAGFCQVIATCPMEMSMITLQTRAATNLPAMSLWECGKSLGIKGLYKGTAATLFRDVPFSMIFFSMNASLKNWLRGGDEDRKLGIGNVFLAGTIAGSTAATLSTPMDVIKTRLQASETVKLRSQSLNVAASTTSANRGIPTGATASSSSTGVATAARAASSSAAAVEGMIQYRGIWHCLTHIAKTEGPLGFMNGVVPRILIISPLFGIALLSYEVQQRLISSGSL